MNPCPFLALALPLLQAMSSVLKPVFYGPGYKISLTLSGPTVEPKQPLVGFWSSQLGPCACVSKALLTELSRE